MRGALLVVVIVIAAGVAGAAPAPPRVIDPIGDTASVAPIVGGHDAASGAWPDAVAVFAGGKMTCAGVLVAPDVVVTAGHCCGTAGSTLDPPPDHVIIGARSLSAPSGSGAGETIAVTQAIAHPDHVNDLDVGVLMLATPSTKTPRALATGWAAAEARDGATATIAGWGQTSPGAPTGSDVLQEASVTIVEADCTSTSDGCRSALMPGGELRAGGGGTDTCGGDSGGPLYVTASYGTYLAATTYAGYATAGAMCGDGGIYERADRSIAWIEQASGRTLPHVADPSYGEYEIVAGQTITAPITVGDPDPTAAHTFEIVAPPMEGTAAIAADGMVTYTASNDLPEQVADSVLVRVHDAAVPARARLAELHLMIQGGGDSSCSAGGAGARGASLPFALIVLGLRRRARSR